MLYVVTSTLYLPPISLAEDLSDDVSWLMAKPSTMADAIFIADLPKPSSLVTKRSILTRLGWILSLSLRT